MEYVIIGDGIAGASAAEKLSELVPEASVTVFTDEEDALYNRIMLKTFMKGTLPVQYTRMHDESWYGKRGIELCLETRVKEVNTSDNAVILESGEEHTYDKLLIATGGSPRKYSLDDEYENLLYMWTLKDAEEIKESAENSDKAVVIGGGLLGIDLAIAYAENDCETYYLIRGENWWSKGLSKEGAEIVHRKMEDKGIVVMTNTEASEFVGDNEIETVVTDSGEELDCDSVAVAIGQTANSGLIDVDKNEADMIKTDEYLQTSDDDVFAAGNMVEYRSPVFDGCVCRGSWDHSEAMGVCAAENMLGREKVFDYVNTYGVGHFDVQFLAIGDWSGEALEKKYSDSEYRRLFFNGDKLSGAVMIGFTKGQERIKEWIREGRVFEDREELLQKEFWN